MANKEWRKKNKTKIKRWMDKHAIMPEDVTIKVVMEKLDLKSYHDFYRLFYQWSKDKNEDYT